MKRFTENIRQAEVLQRKIQEAIEALPPETRLVVNLARTDLSYTEIAELLEISGAAIKVRLHRARYRVRKYLDGESGD